MEEREDNSTQEKTEDPTEERRRNFREEGNIPSPKEMVGTVAIAILLFYFYFGISGFLDSLVNLIKLSWISVPGSNINESSLFWHLKAILKPLVSSLSFLIICLFTMPLLVGFVFTKFNWSWKKIAFNLNKIDLSKGIKRVFGTHTLVELMKIIIKLAVLLSIIVFMLKFEIVKLGTLYTYPYETLLAKIGSTLFYLILVILIGSLCFALFDYGYNWFSLEKKMKMTKQELKEDIKKSEGDPAIKGRRRSFGRDLVLRKSLQDTQKATFVVTNPDHYAIAIRYVTGMNAPIILAKGVNFLAEKIKSIANKHDIIIVENKPLARTLYKTSKIGEEVPQSLYQPLIEVMKYIYQIKGKDYFEKQNQFTYEV